MVSIFAIFASSVISSVDKVCDYLKNLRSVVNVCVVILAVLHIYSYLGGLICVTVRVQVLTTLMLLSV